MTLNHPPKWQWKGSKESAPTLRATVAATTARLLLAVALVLVLAPAALADPAADALTALKGLASLAATYPSYRAYGAQVGDAKLIVGRFLSSAGEEPAKASDATGAGRQDEWSEG